MAPKLRNLLTRDLSAVVRPQELMGAAIQSFEAWPQGAFELRCEALARE